MNLTVKCNNAYQNMINLFSDLKEILVDIKYSQISHYFSNTYLLLDFFKNVNISDSFERFKIKLKFLRFKTVFSNISLSKTRWNPSSTPLPIIGSIFRFHFNFWWTFIKYATKKNIQMCSKNGKKNKKTCVIWEFQSIHFWH